MKYSRPFLLQEQAPASTTRPWGAFDKQRVVRNAEVAPLLCAIPLLVPRGINVRHEIGTFHTVSSRVRQHGTMERGACRIAHPGLSTRCSRQRHSTTFASQDEVAVWMLSENVALAYWARRPATKPASIHRRAAPPGHAARAARTCRTRSAARQRWCGEMIGADAYGRRSCRSERWRQSATAFVSRFSHAISRILHAHCRISSS